MTLHHEWVTSRRSTVPTPYSFAVEVDAVDLDAGRVTIELAASGIEIAAVDDDNSHWRLVASTTRSDLPGLDLLDPIGCR